MSFGKVFSIVALLVLKSGERAIRFRPALDLTREVVDEAMDLLREQCQRMK